MHGLRKCGGEDDRILALREWGETRFGIHYYVLRTTGVLEIGGRGSSAPRRVILVMGSGIVSLIENTASKAFGGPRGLDRTPDCYYTHLYLNPSDEWKGFLNR